MIRLGSLAGYPFEGPRVLAGWTPPGVAAVYAVVYKPEPAIETYAVIYVDHSDDLSTERLPFNHPRSCLLDQAGGRSLQALDLHVRGARRSPLAPRADRPRAHRHLPPGLQPRSVRQRVEGPVDRRVQRAHGRPAHHRPRPRHRSVMTVWPQLRYDDPIAAVTWLCRVFGFTEESRMTGPDGTLYIADLRTPLDARVMVSGRPPFLKDHMRKVLPDVLSSPQPTKDGPTSPTRSRCSCPTSTRTSPTLGGKARRSSPNRATNRGDSATTKRSTSKAASGTSAKPRVRGGSRRRRGSGSGGFPTRVRQAGAPRQRPVPDTSRRRRCPRPSRRAAATRPRSRRPCG